jgi:hypothetical protein
MRVNAIFISALVLLAACTQVSLGPSVAVMPAPGKPFDLFVSEEALCRRYADQQVGISPQQALQNGTVTGAVAGTALGAAAGGAIGAAVGSPGPGAAIGAGTGLLTGSAVGANAGYGATWTIQRRYDIAYEQCMYAKGNQIPGFPTAYAPPPLSLLRPRHRRHVDHYLHSFLHEQAQGVLAVPREVREERRTRGLNQPPAHKLALEIGVINRGCDEARDAEGRLHDQHGQQ